MSSFTRASDGSSGNGHSSYSDLFEDFFRSDALEVSTDADPATGLPYYQSDVFFNLASDQQPFQQPSMGQTAMQASPCSSVYQAAFTQTPTHLVHAAAVCKPGFVRTKTHQRRNQYTTKRPAVASAVSHNTGKPTVALVSPNTLYQASTQFPAFYQQQKSQPQPQPQPQAAAQYYTQLPQQGFYGYPIEAVQQSQALPGHSQQGSFLQQQSLYPAYPQAMQPGFPMAPMPQAVIDQGFQQHQHQLQQGQQPVLLPNSTRLAPIPASSSMDGSVPRASSSLSPTGLRGSPNTSDFVKQKLQAKIRARMIQKGQIPPNATAEEIRYYTSQDMVHSGAVISSTHSKSQSALPTPKSSPKHAPARFPLSEKLQLGTADSFVPADPKDPMVQFSMSSQKQQQQVGADIFCLDQLAQPSADFSSLAAASQTSSQSNLTAANYDQFFSDFILF